MKDLYYSNGKIYLNIENKGNQQVMVNILNLNGQLVKFEKFQLNNQGISSQSIDVANLPKGVYIVSLNIEGNLTTRNVYID